MITVDLENMRVIGPDGTGYTFEMHSLKRRCLLQGLDDISLTNEYSEEIKAFETDYRHTKPFLTVQQPD
jgi:3-isopropylmalate/(R)-2-methylmalate dehydratase small subunit